MKNLDYGTAAELMRISPKRHTGNEEYRLRAINQLRTTVDIMETLPMSRGMNQALVEAFEALVNVYKEQLQLSHMAAKEVSDYALDKRLHILRVIVDCPLGLNSDQLALFSRIDDDELHDILQNLVDEGEVQLTIEQRYVTTAGGRKLFADSEILKIERRGQPR